MKNNLLVILIILLAVSIGLAVYFYIGGQNKLKELQTELNKAKLEIENIKKEKAALEEKLTVLEDKKNKGLAYAEYLDVVVFPILSSSGITPRFRFDNDMKWLSEVEKRTENFNNSELSSYLNKLKSRDNNAFGLILNWTLGEIEKTLK